MNHTYDSNYIRTGVSHQRYKIFVKLHNVLSISQLVGLCMICRGLSIIFILYINFYKSVDTDFMRNSLLMQQAGLFEKKMEHYHDCRWNNNVLFDRQC